MTFETALSQALKQFDLDVARLRAIVADPTQLNQESEWCMDAQGDVNSTMKVIFDLKNAWRQALDLEKHLATAVETKRANAEYRST